MLITFWTTKSELETTHLSELPSSKYHIRLDCILSDLNKDILQGEAKFPKKKTLGFLSDPGAQLAKNYTFFLFLFLNREFPTTIYLIYHNIL
jgi:hypothetical protein